MYLFFSLLRPAFSSPRGVSPSFFSPASRLLFSTGRQPLFFLSCAPPSPLLGAQDPLFFLLRPAFSSPRGARPSFLSPAPQLSLIRLNSRAVTHSPIPTNFPARPFPSLPSHHYDIVQPLILQPLQNNHMTQILCHVVIVCKFLILDNKCLYRIHFSCVIYDFTCLIVSPQVLLSHC